MTHKMTQKMKQTTDFSHRTDTFASASGAPIFYQEWQPSSPAKAHVLIVHGVGEHSGRYRHLVQALLAAGYAVYGHDHQGFGRSGGARGFVSQFRDYLGDISQMLALAQTRNPALPCCLYGHSMGGLIGLYYLLEMPGAIDLAVISAPGLHPQLDPLNRFLKQVMVMLNRVRPSLSFPQPGSLHTISRDAEEVRLAQTDPLWVRKRSARWVVEIFATMREVAARAGEIRLPLLMLQGSADAIVSPEATQTFFENVSSPDKTLRLYEGYYHEIHNDLGREKPLADVIAWLDERCESFGAIAAETVSETATEIAAETAPQ